MNGKLHIVAAVACMVSIVAIASLWNFNVLPSKFTVSVEPLAYDVRFELFVDYGNGLYRNSSIVSFGGASSNNIDFLLSSDSVHSIRIDPGSRSLSMRITGIDYGSYHWGPQEIFRDFKPTNDISDYRIDGGAIFITTTGEDPQLYSTVDFKNVYASLHTDMVYAEEKRKNIFYVLSLALAAIVYFYLNQGRLDNLFPQILTERLASKYFLVFLFFGFLWAPTAASLIQFFPQPNILGKRLESVRPKLSAQTLTSFPKMYESYFNDNFGFRHSLIRINNLVKVRYLKTSPEKKVVLGKDGWLFYDTDNYPGDGVTLNDFRGLAPFSTQEMDKIRSELERRRDSLAKYDIQYVVAVAPNKSTIYDDYLPEYVTKIGAETRLDQLMRFLATTSTLKLVDPRPALRDGRAIYPTYLKTNSHWNDYGALLAYGEIMKEIAPRYHDLKILTPSDFDLFLEDRERGDIGDMLAIGDILGDVNVGLRARGQINKNVIGKLVFLHDSFGNWLEWFLSQHFDPIVDLQTQHFFDMNRIISEKPAIVIQLIAERYLDKLGVN